MNRRIYFLSVRAVSLLLITMLIGGVSVTGAVGAQKQLTLDEVRRRGVLVVGMNAAYAPFEYIEKGGTIVGFDVDLIRILVDKLGVKARLVDTEWAGVIPALYTGKFDVIISAMTITPQRAKRVNFSIPYVEATPYLLVKASSPYEKIEDLIGRVVAVQLGGAGETQVRGWDQELKKKHGKGFKDILTLGNVPDIWLAVDVGRADAAIGTLVDLQVFMKKNPGKYRAIPGLGERAFFGIATRKQDIELKQYFDRQIRDLKRSGQLAALQMKWFGFVTAVPDELPAFAK